MRPPDRRVFCKPYHRALRRDDPGDRRTASSVKSRCPGWADNPAVRERLLQEAVVDPDGGDDSFGRARRLWNAVDGWFFVAMSANALEPLYNCYPEAPATALYEELTRRAQRSLEDVLREDRL